MLSRVAESLYWMSRYVERAENIARLIDVNLQLAIDLPGADEQWQPLVAVTGDHEWFREHYGTEIATREQALDFLAFNREYQNSLVACLRAARENARGIREIISSEMWERLNQFNLTVQEAATRLRNGGDAHFEFFQQVKVQGHLFTGLTEDTLAHNEAWHFCRLGRLLERADQTSRMLDMKYFYLLPSAHDVGSPLDEVHWTAVLRSASGYEMYRQKHGRITGPRVASYLVLDREFPRAILSCLMRAELSLHEISGTSPNSFTNAAERQLGRLRSELTYAQESDLLERGLHEYADAFQNRLNGVGQAIFASYFALQAAPPETHGDLMATRPG